MISQALNVNSASIICAVGEQGERNAVEFELFDKNKTIKDGGISPLTIKWGFNHQIPYEMI